MAAGCGTLTGGLTQKVSVKTQKAAVDIAGANCVLTNSKGTYEVVTPGTVKVHRAKAASAPNVATGSTVSINTAPTGLN